MGKLSSLGHNCQAAKKINGTKSSLVAVGMAVQFGCPGDLYSASLVASLWLMDESSGQTHSQH